MKRKMASTTTALLFLLSVITLSLPHSPVGQAQENPSTSTESMVASTTSPQERSLEDLEAALRDSQELKDLINFRDEITQRVTASRVSARTLRRAYESGDERRIAALLGYSDTDLLLLNQRLDNLRRALLTTFPEIQRLMATTTHSPCGFSPSPRTCGTARFFDNFEGYTQGVSPMYIEPEPGGGEVTCQWAPYTAALAVCTLAGPIWYWPCAYVATCSFCRGGWVATACQQS